ncbi:hypothetical protein F5050DRAFT_1461885 [Lentinula boryana]|uniref:Uncharacterized protein n=1 Tax=Lentinula boryana TaxID=40481 RepID=A0ABQ8QFB9_9AGAR|nr:hypothetical protein F5050DRAFT_1461885 [Lentinula boryana]
MFLLSLSLCLLSMRLLPVLFVVGSPVPHRDTAERNPILSGIAIRRTLGGHDIPWSTTPASLEETWKFYVNPTTAYAVELNWESDPNRSLSWPWIVSELTEPWSQASVLMKAKTESEEKEKAVLDGLVSNIFFQGRFKFIDAAMCYLLDQEVIEDIPVQFFDMINPLLDKEVKQLKEMFELKVQELASESPRDEEQKKLKEAKLRKLRVLQYYNRDIVVNTLTLCVNYSWIS